MQALVLAGGQATRLRPLTLTVPKPVMPLAGRPFLSFTLDWLGRHGVDEVILSCGFLADGVRRVLGDAYGEIGLRYVTEDEPLGTAGPVRLARELLAERVIVVNGDVLTDLDVSAQVARHVETGALATLALTEVDDVTSYGVVPTGAGGEVEDFLEKTAGPVPTNRINAGCYVLERDVIERIPDGRAVSFEREVFPELVGHGLYGFPVDGYWIDIGTPDRYLEATHDLLSGRVESPLPARGEGDSLVGEGSLVDGATIGPLAVVGDRCRIGSGSHVDRAVLFDGVAVGQGCTITRSVVAEDATLGDGTLVEPGALIGRGATLAAGTVVQAGARVGPGEAVG